MAAPYGTRLPDVLIVGSGIAGASLAWHLASRCRVHVVEQGPRECLEASSQNAGMLRRLVDSPDERRLACRTHQLVHELMDHSGSEWPFRRTGSIVAVSEPRSARATVLAAAARSLREQGVQVDRVEGDRLGAFAPCLGRSSLAHGYHVPDDGVCDARALGEFLIRNAAGRGALVEFDTRVLGFVRSGDRVLGVRTQRGTIHADQVVVATAAWTPPLSRELGLHGMVQPTSRHAFVTAPVPNTRQDAPWCWIDDVDVWVRPYRNGYLCSPCDETPCPAPIGPGSTGTPRPELAERMRALLRRHVPSLANVQFVDGWVGLRTFGPNRAPLVGPDPHRAGLFWLTALGGSGVGIGLALGERASRAILASTGSSSAAP